MITHEWCQVTDHRAHDIERLNAEGWVVRFLERRCLVACRRVEPGAPERGFIRAGVRLREIGVPWPPHWGDHGPIWAPWGLRECVEIWLHEHEEWVHADISRVDIVGQWRAACVAMGTESAAATGALAGLVRAAWGRDVFAANDRGDGVWRVYQAHREYVIGMGRGEQAALRSALECSEVSA